MSTPSVAGIHKPAARLQPYQLLFPIGVLYAIAGVGVWALHGLGWAGYPGAYHPYWMVAGFLFSFSAGFLMTAIPRFTGTESCSETELLLAGVLAAGQFLHLGFTAALFLLLLGFSARRFPARQYDPPPHFLFVGLGLLLGAVGSFGLTAVALGSPLEVPIGAFRVFLFQGVMLCFVVGIGARLVRVLLGYESTPLVQISRVGKAAGASTQFRLESRSAVFGLFALMCVGFLLELFAGFEGSGRGMRAIATTWVALGAWKLHRLPPRRGALATGLYVSCVSIVVGTWVYALLPGWEIHSAHLLFAGGFGSIAVMVASRVTLAHGGYGLEQEQKSRTLHVTWALLFLAMLTRVAAPFTDGYLRHLTYAGATAALGFGIWSFWLFGRLKHSGN